MMKSKREQELELENKKLKKEIETLKKTLKIQDKQLKNKTELLEDLLKENKTSYYKNKIVPILVNLLQQMGSKK